ncbi:MAG: CoA pyrophosphatase [Candidatus Tectomicrobia bacterium]|uniref:CoA pyrophosphatase n=1 Tax=Tectimicrobiota bacterium TaxID=2528274 RepID=A0A933LR27_UNCTE|nr:CoA pyrophosphatase [Candidatus Tectomicrobia bacterium]
MIEAIRTLLSSRTKNILHDPSYKKSAVLIPVYDFNGDYHMIFTQRTEKLAHHKGQISFPGGRKDEADATLQETALRESYEEIGITPEDVSVIGELDDFKTLSSGYIISPFVGLIPYPYYFKANLDEIDRIIEVPLAFLLDQSNERQEVREWNGEIVEHYYYDYNGDIIWGATGRILKHFLEILGPIRSKLSSFYQAS